MTTQYTYDANNRISGIQIPGQGQITYNAYEWNSPTKVTLPGGSTTDYTYDPLMRIKSITAKDPGQNQILTRSYDYSQTGNITAKNTEHGNYTYQYDKLYHLTNADNPASANEAYTYDPLGNRITSAQTAGDWTYNANNELTGYNGTSLEYDASGNTTKKTVGATVTNFIYNQENRLTEVRDGSNSLIASYYYDPFGRRLWKEVDGTRTYFLYSDEGLIGEYDAAGAEIKIYGYVPDSQWSTAPLFVKANGIYYWYQNDHLGTPQKIINTSGATAWAATYDSFGNTQIGTQNITSNLRFAGQYYDAETGFYYNYHRYYDPVIGRYLRTDPFGDGINLYVFVLSNPINWIDPMGLCASSSWTSRVFAGSQYGGGVGARGKISLFGLLKIEAGAHDILGKTVTPQGIEEFSEERIGASIAIFNVKFTSEIKNGKGSLRPSLEVGRISLKDITTIELGGTIPHPSGAAINFELHIHLNELFGGRR